MHHGLRIDREVLWRKLFAFDDDDGDDVAAADSATASHEDVTDHFCSVIQSAVAHGRADPLRAMLRQRLGHWLRLEIVPPFWHLCDTLLAETPKHRRLSTSRSRRQMARRCTRQLTLALQFAEDAFAHCVQVASLFDDDAQGPLLHRNKATRTGPMLQQLRTSFRCLVFDTARARERFEALLVVCFSQTQATARADSRSIQQTLQQLEWLHVAESALGRVLRARVQKAVASTCAHVYDELLLGRVEQQVRAEVWPWLDELLPAADVAGRTTWRQKLSQHVLEAFARLRIAQLFELIKEFPDSVPALDDLRQCLERTQQQDELVRSFRSSLQKRLLQPGANTSAILEIYVSIIKAFRLLDPKGVLLEALSGPLIEYLRQRKDTVRCIVQSLTDDEHGDLFNELRRDNTQIIQHVDDSDDDEDISPDSWEPDPIEADPSKTSRSRRSDDILRILVNIYGSRELFVNEYRMMLADKLLQNLKYDTDRDVQTLELLKLRFGEESLQQCEIMVRDIEDSKRLNVNVRSSMEDTVAKAAVAEGDVIPTDQAEAPSSYVDATIVSRQFWPPLQGEDFALHPTVMKKVVAFTDSYHVLRNPRSLNWNSSLGSVQLSIDLEGKQREFTVSPLQATIMLYFEEKDRWTVEELSAKLEISDDLLLKHVSVWVNCGLVSFTLGRKELVASTSFQDTRCDGNSSVEELETAVSSDAQAEEDLKVLENYIVGMLSNFGSLSIQRIHNMLSTFARSGTQPYTKTISGLSSILGKLVTTGKLELVGDQYQLST